VLYGMFRFPCLFSPAFTLPATLGAITFFTFFSFKSLENEIIFSAGSLCSFCFCLHARLLPGRFGDGSASCWDSFFPPRNYLLRFPVHDFPGPARRNSTGSHGLFFPPYVPALYGKRTVYSRLFVMAIVFNLCRLQRFS